MKPYDLARMEREVARRIVEAISKPWKDEKSGDEMVMVRMVPGDPTTMKQVRTDFLHPHNKNRYVHLARVNCAFTFPQDMLRYNNAAFYDHLVGMDDDNPEVQVGPVGILVYTTSNNQKNPWTIDRWNSFSARIELVYVRDLLNRTDDNIVKRDRY